MGQVGYNHIRRDKPAFIARLWIEGQQRSLRADPD
jgi:hypothetical protein